MPTTTTATTIKTERRPALLLLSDAKEAHRVNLQEVLRVQRNLVERTRELAEVSEKAKVDATLSGRKRKLEATVADLMAELDGSEKAAEHTDNQITLAEALCGLEDIQDRASEMHIPTDSEHALGLEAFQAHVDRVFHSALDNGRDYDATIQTVGRKLHEVQKDSGVPNGRGSISVRMASNGHDVEQIRVETLEGVKIYRPNRERNVREVLEKSVGRWQAKAREDFLEATREEREAKAAEANAIREERFKTQVALDGLSKKEVAKA